MVTGGSHGSRSSLKVGDATRVFEERALSLHKHSLNCSTPQEIWNKQRRNVKCIGAYISFISSEEQWQGTGCNFISESTFFRSRNHLSVNTLPFFSYLWTNFIPGAKKEHAWSTTRPKCSLKCLVLAILIWLHGQREMSSIWSWSNWFWTRNSFESMYW